MNCDVILSNDEKNASECRLLKNFVCEHKATPNHAFYLAYVVDSSILFLKAFDGALLVCEGFDCAYVCKCLLRDCHHLTLRFLIRFIVLPVEAHEYPVAKNTRCNEQQSIERQFPTVGKHNNNHADYCAERLYER